MEIKNERGAKELEKRIQSAMTDLDGIESYVRDLASDSPVDPSTAITVQKINHLIRSIREKLDSWLDS